MAARSCKAAPPHNEELRSPLPPPPFTADAGPRGPFAEPRPPPVSEPTAAVRELPSQGSASSIGFQARLALPVQEPGGGGDFPGSPGLF